MPAYTLKGILFNLFGNHSDSQAETETVPPSYAKSGRRAAAQMAPCTPLSSDHGHH